MFFLFLFFAIFFALVLIGIQSIDPKNGNVKKRLNDYDPRVTKSDIGKLKKGSNVTALISAMKDVADSPFYANDIRGQINSIAFDLSQVEIRIQRLELQKMVFLLMISSLALFFGLVASAIAFFDFLGGI